MTLLTDAFTAYLSPLLKKHSGGESLIWEDLEVSRATSMEVLKHSDNVFVSKRIEDLHQSQIQAYREAAVKALREWAQSDASLEPMDENDTEDLFVERCVNAALLSRPNWRLDSAKMVVVMEIRKRARAAFAKYHPSVGDVVESGSKTTFSGETKDPSHANDNNENNHDEEEDEGDDEDGEVNEDGEMDDDDQEDDGQADEEAGTKTNSAQKSVDMGPKKKGTKNKKKKVIVRKKSTNPKPTIQPRKAVLSNRGRRVGRGGSNAGSSKSG